MIDTVGTNRARYDYDPYGTRTKVSGDMDADFSFTGDYNHQNSGLLLTLYRAYDTGIGRWMSRDPLAEDISINLYAYVENDPINWEDSLGLYRWGQILKGALAFGAGVGLVAFGLAASPLIGIAAIGVGAVGVGLGLYNFGNGIKDEGSRNIPSNAFGLAGQYLDQARCPYRDPEVAGPLQKTGDIIGSLVNQIPKIAAASKALPSMISTSTSPPSPISPPSAPFPKPDYSDTW